MPGQARKATSTRRRRTGAAGATTPRKAGSARKSTAQPTTTRALATARRKLTEIKAAEAEIAADLSTRKSEIKKLRKELDDVKRSRKAIKKRIAAEAKNSSKGS
jgi:septal ring factor EnvC (AmiA/AmiB activator)